MKKRNLLNKMLALAMSLCMIFTMMPMAAHATETQETYTVYLNSSGGSGTLSGDGSYAVGTTVTITATPTDGSCFYMWGGGDGAALADYTAETTTFTMPANDVTITANFRTHSESWGYTEDEHYKTCLFCGEVAGTRATHSYSDDADTECECGWTREVHTHDYSDATCTTPATCDCGETTGGVDKSNHTGGTEIRNTKDATETEDGYTGDTYCLGCGDKLSDGETIPATHTHDYSDATCTTPATCGCGETTGDVDKSNHTGGTEVRNAKDATETEDGYTGDTYCLGCGDKLSDGETTPATGGGDDDDDTHTHDYTAVVTAPTCSDRGYTTYTCSCNDSYVSDYVDALGHDWGDYISNGDGTHTRTCTADSDHKQTEGCSGGTATCNARAACSGCGGNYGSLNSTNHSGGTEVRNAKDATETEDGYTGDTYCLGCNTKIKTGSTIPATGGGDDDDDTHVHDYKYLMGNNTQHWYECECGEKTNIEDHSLEWRRKDKVLGDRVSISGLRIWEEGHYQICSGCNYKTAYQHHEGTCTMETDPMLSPEKYHRIDCDICGEWTYEDHYYVFLYNDTHHWKTCPCGYGFDKDKDMVAHTFVTEEENGVVVTYCTGCDWQTTHAHRYTIANCASPSVCSCGVTSGEKNPNNHTGGTEIRNAAEATIVAEGYTGDTYCLGCGSMIASGEVIPKAGVIFEDPAGATVTFTPVEGLVLPEDAVLVVEPHTPSGDDLDFVLGIDADTEYLDADDVKIQIVGDGVCTAPDGTEYSMYEIIRINGEEYLITNYMGTGDVLALMRLSDGATCSYLAAVNVLDFNGSMNGTVQDYAYDKVNIGGVTYDVQLSYANAQGTIEVILYYNGSPAAKLLSSEDCYFLEGFDPETLKAQQSANDLGTVTPGENPIDGLVSGKTYNVSVIGSNDIHLEGAENVSGTVTQTFDIPVQFVNNPNVKFIAVHDTNPHATALAAAKLKMEEAWANYLEYHGDSYEEKQRLFEAANRAEMACAIVQVQYDAWEKEHAADTGTGNDLGTVTIAEDGKTLTATYTVSSFSPFTVYAFVEADEPEIKTLSATIVDSSDDTTEAPDTSEPVEAPQTSDNAIWYILIAVVAGTIAVVSVVYGKRRKNKVN